MQEKYRGRGASSRGFVPRIGKKRKFVGDATQVSGRVVALPQASHPYPSTITPIRTHIQYISYIKTLNIHYTQHIPHIQHMPHINTSHTSQTHENITLKPTNPQPKGKPNPTKKKGLKKWHFGPLFPQTKANIFFFGSD